MDSQQKVFEYIEQIPLGRLVTYGSIGKALNLNPRFVGRVLHNNLDPSKYPCHRVVRSDGGIASGYAFGGKVKQIEMLKKEGIVIVNEKVKDFSKYYFELK